MLFNNKKINLKLTTFSNEPFSFTSPEVHNDLASILEIDLIENGNRQAREQWQEAQLLNLLNFAHSQSPFWKKRIPPDLTKDNLLKKLQILKREDVLCQVKNEGSLAKNFIKTDAQTYESSGSTGTPVKVHVCPQNGRYNEMRGLAQYFMDDRELNDNKTFIKPSSGHEMIHSKKGIKVENFDSWIGRFKDTFVSGKYKVIHFSDDIEALVDELLKDRVGYLACVGTHMDLLLQYGGADLIKKLGIRMWLHLSDNRDVAQVSLLKKIGIPVMSTYSCSEVGPIAVECKTHAGYYHVTHSNVIVEMDENLTVEVEGIRLGRVLITHLHSYATPLIRYDIGDFALLERSCPCGHDGSTLSHIYGRRKCFLKNMDGTFSPFPIFSNPFLDITSCTDFFIYQKDLKTIVVELGGREAIALKEEKNIQNFIQRLSNNSFDVIVKPVLKINWARNPKRLPFVNLCE